MESDGKKQELETIRDEVSVCEKCVLSRTRNQTVPGEGNPDADIMFIGEAPGANEDKHGIPFCGSAGKFLDEMLASINLKREDVFITNTVKCRPPQNRDPEEDEKKNCRPYLDKQFEIINPKIIILLGKHATANFLPAAGGITKLHGRPLRKPNGQVYLPLYHPAAALHNGSLRQTLLDDFAVIQSILKKIDKLNKNKKEEKDSEQLKLI